MPDIVVAKHLFKQFKEVVAIHDLSFTVPQGKIYGFLGQNGAGKSTTIRMLLTLIEPTDGEIEIFGLNLKKHRTEILKRTGAIIERPDVYKYLSALDNLHLFATMSGIKLSSKKLLEQLDKVGLVERAKSKVKTYSQGMKQRLGIAIALLNDPALIILDEPMNGLDPQGIADIRNLILHLSRDLKKTIFLSSHLLTEMELIADSMLIIDKGKKIVEGTMKELFDPTKTIADLQTKNADDVYNKLQQTELKKFIYKKDSDHILFQLHRNELSLLMKKLAEMNVEIISLSSKHSLENYFLSLTTENQHVESFKN